MFKTYSKHLKRRRTSRLIRTIGLLCGLTMLCLIATIYTNAPTAYAAGPTVTIALAGGNADTPTGHAGTQVTITGTGFPAGTVNLYTTTSNDPAQCTMGAQGLQPFSPRPIVPARTLANGVTAAWPNNANTPGTAYYICAISSLRPDVAALSSNTFTVTQAQNVTMSLSQTTVNAGDQITITGANWPPSQAITAGITNPGQRNSYLANGHVNSDAQGNFSVTLTIPANAPAGSYGITAVVDNDRATNYHQENALTINAAAPTPTPTVAPTATPTIAPTATPTAATTTTPTTTPGGTSGNTPSSGGGTTPLSLLIFGLGGMGILLVIIGGVVFAVYSRPG